MSETTPQLPELAARAQTTNDTKDLTALLRQGHTAWCQAVADVQRHTAGICARLDDQAATRRCTAADTP